MRTESEILTYFDDWAREHDLVRAAVLTSSRVHPDAAIDFLSDYDIELYVSDIEPFLKDDAWLEPFGPILVRWPATPRPTGDEAWITRLVLFRDGVRIDFQITAKTEIEPNAYRNGYRVLLDKDGLTQGLHPPTHDEFVIRPPSRETFETRAREFWWDATYVPKYLYRDELPFAKYMLDHILRHHFLHPMVEWTIGFRTEWKANTGVCGRAFKRYLDEETWEAFASTYSGAGLQANLDAFGRMLSLYRRLGRELADALGYAYPDALDESVTDYCNRLLGRLADKPTVTWVAAYNPRWADWFAEIKAYLLSGLDDVNYGFEHVGSTSISGMWAKPIIDLDVVIPKGGFAGVKVRLEGLGYVHQGDLGLTGREVFDLIDPTVRLRLPAHHLYVCEEDAYELKKHIAYREFMRLHPEWRERLNRLKVSLCHEHGNDRQAYIEGKSAMVEEITRQSLAPADGP